MPANILKTITQSIETTFGTTVAPTIKYHSINDASVKMVDEVRVVDGLGLMGPSGVVALMSESAEFSMERTETYHDLRYAWNGALMTATASSAAGGPPWSYDYTAPLASTPTIQMFGFEYGTTGVPYRLSGCLLNTLNIKGEAGGVWETSVDYLARRVIASSSGMSTAVADRTIEPIRMSDTNLYVDVSTGTIGTSTTASTLIGFEFSLETGRHLKMFAGSVSPTTWGDARFVSKLKTTLEFNATAKAYVDAMVGAGTTTVPALVQRLIRIKADNSGTSSAARTATIDFAGVLEGNHTLFSDRDGNMTVELSWTGYNSTSLGNYLAAQVQVNSSAAS